MTAPRYAPCRCGHDKGAHEPLAPQCSSARCECLAYRPVLATAPQPTQPPTLRQPLVEATHTAVPTPAAQPTIEQLVAAGKRSTHRPIANLAARIETQAATLRQALRDDRARAESQAVKAAQAAAKATVKATIAKLEAELAAAKRALRGTPPPSRQDAAARGRGATAASVPRRRLRPPLRQHASRGDAPPTRPRRIRPARREGRVTR